MHPSRSLIAALLGTALLVGCGERTEADGSAAASPTPSPATPSPATPSPATPSPTVSGTAAPLPAELDLMTGMVSQSLDHDVVRQGSDGTRIAPVVMCHEQVWPTHRVEGSHRLVTTVVGPEYFDGRELLSLPSEDEARATMAHVRTVAQGCRRMDNQVWTSLQQDTGHDSVTVGLTYTEGMGSSVVQVTRVGSVLLLVMTYGEGSLDSLPAQAAEVTATTRRITRQVCSLEIAAC